MKGSRRVAEELKLIEDLISLSQTDGRRIAIRSVFSALEILVAELCTHLLDKLPPADLKDHEERHKWFLELCALSNISYRIDDNGHLQLERPNISLKHRTLFALNMTARVTGSDISPKQDEGWKQFVQATKIRNRITHPKTQDDLEVSKQEYATVVEALQWLARFYHRAVGGSQY